MLLKNSGSGSGPGVSGQSSTFTVIPWRAFCFALLVAVFVFASVGAKAADCVDNPAGQAGANLCSDGLEVEAQKTFGEGKPKGVSVPEKATTANEYLGLPNLVSRETIRKTKDWLMDRSAVGLKIVEKALNGIVWVMREQDKEAYDLKFLKDTATKLEALAKNLRDASGEKWDEGVKSAQAFKDLVAENLGLKEEIVGLKAADKNLENQIAELSGQIGGINLINHGVKELDFIVSADMLSRTVKVLDPKTREEIKLRAFYDPHAVFDGKAHQASRLMIVPTERDRHLCLWVMDLGTIWPSSTDGKTLDLHVTTNVATKCYLGVKDAVAFLKKNTPMNGEQIVALLKQ